MYFIFALAVVAALAEGVGIVMILPLLASLGGPDAAFNESLGQNGLATWLQELLGVLGIQYSTTSVLLIITAAILMKGMLAFAAHGLSAFFRGRLLRELKGRLFRQYSRMRYSYYESRDSGHFINIINSQTSQALDAFHSLTQLGTHIVYTTIYLGFAFMIAWRFGLMALLLGVVMLFLFRWLNGYVRSLSRSRARENGHLANLLIQALHAFKYLVATSQMAPIQREIDTSIRRLTSHEIRTGIAGALTYNAREPLGMVFIALIVLVQLVLLQQPITPILVSILLFYRAFNAFMHVQDNWQIALNNIGSVELFRDESLALAQQQEPDGSEVIAPLSQGIRLEAVCFSYDPQRGDAISDVSLDIAVRQTVAFVGQSGAGKSTLVDLITLMLKPQRGRILIDDMPSERIQLDSWRRQIGYVSQETVIFNDTIANNICLWTGSVETDPGLRGRVRKAAAQAHIADVIESLPEGYQTLVGDRGMRLSGGQRQRLFIARELFRKPALLILDEATSALDSESEHAIQRSIDALRGQITVIIIAHRMSTIRNVDEIYVFDHGRLIETGTYQTLRDREDSRFRRLIAMQAL